ncbi:hypothetical protein OCS_06307 [Ophiocordyceps sinensis CO18]|uniref:Autophagy-related protein 6 n=1 Tax=Ophiocordyceps sinensis (strain Co18 / CGMCC 3.14243) TaxID=911162 RepID=T5A894_OPHSC|nr:hypothetical protein OCS_06307 [Ophiocordyceps sinensis CO18]
MGWWSSVFGSNTSADPLKNLDPKLREFLEKESPVKYSPQQQSPPRPTSQDEAKTPEPGPERRQVPAASLFQDGRYAHLWESYRPLSQIEAETASDHDKLANVLEGYKGRKAAIGRAALENCALQQEEWVNCMKRGSWEDQMQMCRHQRFLRALGFGSVMGRSPEVDEDIQMHADSLFQRMLKHEAAVEQAKQSGAPIPVFEVVLPKAKVVAAAPSETLARQWREGLEKLPEAERAVEEAALRADLEAKAEVAANVHKVLKAQREERDARMAEGQATLFDGIVALFGGGGK